jgi:hypothetical protein
MEHRVRVSALEPERIWKLKGDTLWMCTEGNQDIPIPLPGIQKLRLAYEPSRFQTNRFRCYLYNSGGKCATIQNEHYEGIASFTDRSDSYVHFTRALISRIAAVNPTCTFSAGTSQLNWWGQAIFLTVVFGLLALVMLFLYSAIGPLVIIKLVIIALFIPVVIRWFVRNKPKTFSPGTVPDKLLPKQ